MIIKDSADAAMMGVPPERLIREFLRRTGWSARELARAPGGAVVMSIGVPELLPNTCFVQEEAMVKLDGVLNLATKQSCGPMESAINLVREMGKGEIYPEALDKLAEHLLEIAGIIAAAEYQHNELLQIFAQIGLLDVVPDKVYVYRCKHGHPDTKVLAGEQPEKVVCETCREEVAFIQEETPQ